MKKFSSPTQKTGELGEDLVVRFLVDKGHVIVERNYSKKWGEIDIVTKNKDIVHFIEVKSVQGDIFERVSRGTNNIRPEDHLDLRKQERMRRIIETYIQDRKVKEWQFDLVCVVINQNQKQAAIYMIENLIL